MAGSVPKRVCAASDPSDRNARGEKMGGQKASVRTGWPSRITKIRLTVLLFETASGLAVPPSRPSSRWCSGTSSSMRWWG